MKIASIIPPIIAPDILPPDFANPLSSSKTFSNSDYICVFNLPVTSLRASTALSIILSVVFFMSVIPLVNIYTRASAVFSPIFAVVFLIAVTTSWIVLFRASLALEAKDPI